MSMNREFLMLAQQIDSTRHTIGNYFVSVKLDGQRCFWDGGISRYKPKREVPWANTSKDERYREPPVCTGLWSRYGNIIHAPEWFLNQLPKGLMLDGELYLGRGKFQETRKIISTLEPGNGWKNIKYKVFDLPSPNVVFQQGKINSPNFKKFIDENACVQFYQDTMLDESKPLYTDVPRFDVTVARMRSLKHLMNDSWQFLNQIPLPWDQEEAYEKMYEYLNIETDAGGEGIMLRAPSSIWLPKRSGNLLKAKKFDEDDALVVGCVTGLGKYVGMMGALIVQYIRNGKNHQFQLSGFTDAERQLDGPDAHDYALKNPGTILIAPFESKHFKKGTRVRFRHRSFTDEGIPREARYWR